VEAQARDIRYTFLFLAYERGNLAGQFRTQLLDRIYFRSGFFFGVFHVLRPQPASYEDSLLAAAMPSISCLTRGIGNKKAGSGYQLTALYP
jgi:hypothetical protein